MVDNIDMRVRRDMAVGRNATIGGDEVVRGNMTVEHSLKVNGWVESENISMPTVGVFKEGVHAVPENLPDVDRAGLLAGVLVGDTVLLYISIKSQTEGEYEWQETDIEMPLDTVLNTTTAYVNEVDERFDTKVDKVESYTEGRFALIANGGGIMQSTLSPADKVSVVNGTKGNYVVFGENGAIDDSECSPNDLQINSVTADKVNIQLKTGTSATVLTTHQDISGKADKDKLVISDVVGQADKKRIQLKESTHVNVLVAHQDISGKANANEMSVEAGTGADADKTTITLKTGTSATVLTTHQDISGKANKSEMSVIDVRGADDKTIIQLKNGTFATVLKSHQDISGKIDKVSGENIYGHIPVFNSDGSIRDSGITPTSKVSVPPSGTMGNLIMFGYTPANVVDSTISANNILQKVLSATENNIAVFDDDGGIKDGGCNLASKANKSEMDVSTSSGTTTITLKTGTSAQLYSKAKVDEMIADAVADATGRAVGEAVRCTYNITTAGTYRLYNMTGDNDGDLKLIVIDGVGYRDARNIQLSPGTVEVLYVFKDATKIPEEAFFKFSGASAHVPNLTALHLPSFIREIGANAFNGCTNLKAIDCEAMTPPTIGSSAFSDAGISGGTLTVHKVVLSEYDDGSNKWASAGTVDTY